MRIDPDALLVGHPILAVRDLLRRRVFDRKAAEAVLGVARTEAERAIETLAAEDYICPSERFASPDGTMWQTTPKGSKLANASTLPPIPRAEAERIMAEFMERVRRVAGSDDHLAEVVEVVLFGSHLAGASEVNDIDLIVRLRLKGKLANRSYDEALRAKLAEAAAKGKSFATAQAWIAHLQGEALAFLQETSPYLSFHRADALNLIEQAARKEAAAGKSSGVVHDTSHKVIYRARR